MESPDSVKSTWPPGSLILRLPVWSGWGVGCGVTQDILQGLTCTDDVDVKGGSTMGKICKDPGLCVCGGLGSSGATVA